jgi:hypothetical protein
MPASNTEKKRRRGLRAQHKQMQRHRENLFQKTFMRIIAACNATEAFQGLTNASRQSLLLCRYAAMRLDAAADCGFGKKLVEELTPAFNNLLRNRFVTIPPSGFNISYYDYFTLVQFMLSHMRVSHQNNETGAREWFEALAPLRQIHEDPALSPDFFIMEELNLIAIFASNIEKQFFWFKHIIDASNFATLKINEYYEVQCYKPLTKRIVIDRKPHLVYRLGLVKESDHTMLWISLSAEKLPEAFHPKAGKYDVWVQSHALRRMTERLAPVKEYFYQASMITAIGRPEVTMGSKNEFLISLKIFGFKAGYFVAECFGSDIVIRTFLFLTQSGTPEGNMFNARLKVSALEKRYLGLDTLNIFATTDICQDERISAIIEECGCGDLIKIKDKLGKYNNEEKYAAKLRHLLCLDDDGSLQTETATDKGGDAEVASGIS